MWWRTTATLAIRTHKGGARMSDGEHGVLSTRGYRPVILFVVSRVSPRGGSPPRRVRPCGRHRIRADAAMSVGSGEGGGSRTSAAGDGPESRLRVVGPGTACSSRPAPSCLYRSTVWVHLSRLRWRKLWPSVIALRMRVFSSSEGGCWAWSRSVTCVMDMETSPWGKRTRNCGWP